MSKLQIQNPYTPAPPDGHPVVVAQTVKSGAEKAGPGVMTYGKLRQTNPQYDVERMAELHTLHAGGYDAQKQAEKYLPQLVNEHTARYSERKKCAAFIGYFGQIVEQLTSDLFAQPLTVTPAGDKPGVPGDSPDEDFYSDFESDVDTEGTSFVDLLKLATTQALVQRAGYVCLDAADPDDDEDGPAKNAADEQAKGQGRIYAYEVSPRSVLDWKLAKGGKDLEWAVVGDSSQDRETPDDVRNDITETYTIWEMRGKGDARRAWFRRYVVTYDPKEPPKDDAPVKLAKEGQTSFKRLPLLRMLFPKGLWMGNKAGPVQKEHWQRRSTLNSAENRSMVAIPFVKRGPEIGGVGGPVPSDTQENPTRGRDPVGTFNKNGAVELGSDDELGFAEPEGKCYELVDKQLDGLKDELFRVVFQMAASVKNTPGTMGRSGLSKAKDGEITALVLRAIGHEVRRFAVRIYNVVAEARGEKDVAWVPSGLDTYEAVARESILEEAVGVDEICTAIGSQKFSELYRQQVAEKLLTGLDPETLATIRQQIQKTTKDKHDLDSITRDAAKDDILNPPEPAPPTPAIPPNAKKIEFHPPAPPAKPGESKPSGGASKKSTSTPKKKPS